MKTTSRAVRLIAMAAAVAGGLAFIATAGYAAAATSARSAGPERPAITCLVTAARLTGHGRIRVVEAVATECVTASGSRYTEAVPAKAKLVNIGYGCHRENFSRKGQCWHFAVPRPGCKAGIAWIWKRLRLPFREDLLAREFEGPFGPVLGDLPQPRKTERSRRVAESRLRQDTITSRGGRWVPARQPPQVTTWRVVTRSRGRDWWSPSRRRCRSLTRRRCTTRFRYRSSDRGGCSRFRTH